MLPNSTLIGNIIIILMLTFIIIPPSPAIDVGFSVSDNGGTVAINDKYSVSDSVSVHESGTGGFRPASISSQREVSGPGSINMAQTYSGSGGYNGFNYLFSNNASNNAVHSSASLTPNTLSVSQRASFSNAQQVKFCLGACRGEELVKHYGWLNDGSLSMDQSLNVNCGSMEALIDAHMIAREGLVGSKAVDGLGSEADTLAKIYMGHQGAPRGSLDTSQSASEPIASVSQYSDISALAAIAKSSASSYTGNKAGVLVKLTDGKMTTQQNAWADEMAVAKETSKVWDAKGASSSSWAMNAQGDKVYSKVKVSLSDGTFNSSQFAVANNDLNLWHQTDAGRALSATSFDYALVRDKYLAKTYTDTLMDLGDFSSNSDASVNKSSDTAAAHQLTSSTNALEGFSKTLALELRLNGNKSKTYAKALMDKGNFSSNLGAEASGEGAFTRQKTNATLASQAETGSLAVNSKGDLAETYVSANMSEGNFSTRQTANADADASIYQKTDATKALNGSATSKAVNYDGDRANTSFTGIMNQGMFNNTFGVVAKDENVSIYHKGDATNALYGSSNALAVDSDGNEAKTDVVATMAGGQFDSIMNPEADGGATIYQKTNATKALTGSATSKAVNSDGDRANTSFTGIMNQGMFNNTLGVVANDENVSIYHKGDATNALYGSSNARALDSDGNEAKTDVVATMAGGLFDTVMNPEANGDATIYQKTNATEALTGSANSKAANYDGDWGNTSVTASMNQGTFKNTLGVVARDENVSIYHKADASQALTGTSDAYAEDESGNLASTSVNTTMASGLFDTVMSLEADGSASIYQKTNATLATSGQALTLGVSREGDRANTSVSATMDQGYFNNTLRVHAQDDRVSDYHKFNATEVLTAKKGGQVVDNLGNKSSVAAALIMDHGPFDGLMDLYVEEGAEIYQYMKAEKVLWGMDSAHSEDAFSHKADSSLTITNGMFSNEILARAMSNATIDHGFYARADLIRANVSAWRPGEQSSINTTVYPNRNNIKPATLQGLQTADSNSTGTEANQYIQARGFINSTVRSYSNGLTSNSDLNYDSVGVDSHLWAATNAYACQFGSLDDLLSG